jgi:ABC-2 type transport system ATP-binding protein
MRFEGPIEQLAAQAHAAKRLTITLPQAAQWVPLLQPNYATVLAPQPDKLQLTIPRREEAARVNKMLVEAGAEVYELRLHDGLEEWFMEMTAK